MWLLDTNALILCKKLKEKLFQKGKTFTTILSIIEFPPAFKFKDISVIYHTNSHYEHAFSKAVLLRENDIPIPTIDILIGTISIEKNLTLVSDDSHFEYLKNVDKRLAIISSQDYINGILSPPRDNDQSPK